VEVNPTTAANAEKYPEARPSPSSGREKNKEYDRRESDHNEKDKQRKIDDRIYLTLLHEQKK
jgi:hypothetical protein